jgi:hypothetical protein
VVLHHTNCVLVWMFAGHDCRQCAI